MKAGNASVEFSDVLWDKGIWEEVVILTKAGNTYLPEEWKVHAEAFRTPTNKIVEGDFDVRVNPNTNLPEIVRTRNGKSTVVAWAEWV